MSSNESNSATSKISFDKKQNKHLFYILNYMPQRYQRLYQPVVTYKSKTDSLLSISTIAGLHGHI